MAPFGQAAAKHGAEKILSAIAPQSLTIVTANVIATSHLCGNWEMSSLGNQVQPQLLSRKGRSALQNNRWWQLRAHDDNNDDDDDDDNDDEDDNDDDDADDAHVGGTDALSWELMLSLRTENKQQRPHNDDDGDHYDH